jgi:hypothetical protein
MPQIKLKKLFDGKQISYFPIYLMDLAATSQVKKIIGKSGGMIVTFYKNTDGIIYCDQGPWLAACSLAQKKLVKEKKFAAMIRKKMADECQKLQKFSRGLLKLSADKLTNTQLINLYKEFEKRTLALRGYAWIPNLVDFGDDSIFILAEEKIAEQIGEDEKIKEYISLFTTPRREIATILC